ncbi:MAG: DUF4956 domain-containing protein [Gemmatimonadetes bacterium]|nr:DUF4956 domain-containing protein [Gemmatimonadota bacterium]
MSAKPPPLGRRRRLTSVLIYYIVLAIVILLAERYIPGVHSVLTGGEITHLTTKEMLQDSLQSGPAVAQTPFSGGALGAVAMLGALAIMIPVTWIYMITRQHRGYDESVVHTLLILPVAVTGIVVVVQNSLALAFSLAGIVAGVRFRTTLDDTKDAVYVFLAIGVGLASGIQALGLAMVMSLFFNAVVLVLWKARFGNTYAMAGPGEIGLGDALVGPRTASAVYVVGDASLVDAAAPADLADVMDRAARMERHLADERTKGKTKRANVLLLVHASSAGAAQGVVEPVLAEMTTRFKLTEVVQGAPGKVVLEYLARLEGEGSEGALLDRLRRRDSIVEAVELRSIKGLKKRS